ncbi:hypothetical protein I5907_03885 [Panacibacter sp. DH6]|uniref:Uncharacterized protein n=1 Tax=Panacibacter microcysteis TaxID=2793269 RepID=A0A931GXB8_9BACT|nr:hypothetical protein [Panacibacter microcysteis]MBG9375359.1 hypothetical protein [Panacibacter microcysteis]
MEPNQNPEQPTEQLQDDYDPNSMEGYDKPVRNAKIILFLIAGLQLLPLFMPGDMQEPVRTITIASTLAVAFVFAFFAWWTSYKPYWSILAALIFYILLLTASAIMQPATIIQGVIAKVIAITLLIYALGNAKEVQRWKDSQRK